MRARHLQGLPGIGCEPRLIDRNREFAERIHEGGLIGIRCGALGGAEREQRDAVEIGQPQQEGAELRLALRVRKRLVCQDRQAFLHILVDEGLGRVGRARGLGRECEGQRQQQRHHQHNAACRACVHGKSGGGGWR